MNFQYFELSKINLEKHEIALKTSGPKYHQNVNAP